MTSKVVHISDETHERAKKFCKERNIRMSDWVNSLIMERINGPEAVPVEKGKSLPNLSRTRYCDDPAAEEPFWNKEKEPAVEEQTT
jgi:antitoxin component of RelBE/YafQ-DinJ toxin-antitoxin module